MSVTIKNRWDDSVIATVEDTDDLREAVIRLVKQGADLSSANFRGSDLRGSDLSYSDLSYSDLSYSDLSDSNLSYSNLSYSDLSYSDLSYSNLRGSDLRAIRDDFYAILSAAPAEVPALIAALDGGRVNGSTYSDGECGCLIGTLAIASGIDPKEQSRCRSVRGVEGNSSRPAECFFMGIKKGDTPETNQVAKLSRDWAAEWLERMHEAFERNNTKAEA